MAFRKAKGEKPPHLRPSDGYERCGSCDHMDPFYCTLFEYAVRIHEVCDAWENHDEGVVDEA